MITNCFRSALVLTLAALFCSARVFAQNVVQPTVPDGQPAAEKVEAPAEGTPPGGTPVVVPDAGGGPRKPGKPPMGPDGKPLAVPGQPQAKPGEAPKPEAPKTSPRPMKPAVPPNPEELKVRAGDDGLVRFNFQGQPWLGVLEWLARISQLSLDWQEIPADYLNLRTQRGYTVDEARDLINRHLLDRGFTLLKHGEVLTVVNTKKLDPSLVPRVAPHELDDRDLHEFVKVSFPLESLTAETAVDELKPMLSPNGKLWALKATNRIEALDTVVNLREIRDVLNQEQSHRGRKRLVREFQLEYTRAGEVIGQLRTLLGLEDKPPVPQPGGGQQNPAQQMQMQMEMAQMAQQGGKHGGGPPTPAKQPPAVHLVVNPRENSIVAQAPADQMAVIDEAVKLIDVPSRRSQSLLKNMNRTQVYRMATIDPEPLVKMLQELGDLDPATHLQIDKKNKSIIAYAPLADHLTIRTLVSKLDGTGRNFEVIKLRRLEADYVAGSIEFMMGGGDKKKNQNNNRFNPFFDFYGGGRNNEPEDDSKKFRVDADVEHNRLLLWANAVELEEINHLLVKLGEIPPEGGNSSTLRVIDTIPPEEVEQLLERLRRTWPGTGRNPLEVVPQADDDEATAEPPVKKAPVRKKVAPAKKLPREKTTRATPLQKSPALNFAAARLLPLVQVTEKDAPETAEPDAAEEESPKAARSREPSRDESRAPQEDADEAPLEDPDITEPIPRFRGKAGGRSERRPPFSPPAPIRIGRDPDGRMVISSTDTEALDRLEDLLVEIMPQRKDYKAFKMKHKSTWAYGVALNLKEFFEEKDKNDQRRGRPWWAGSQNTDDERRLSKRRPLKFIADSDSNSILVSGADPNQLKIIEELIALYDIPESKDSAAVRKTKIVQVNYSKARVIADAVKDVYRDLLSANDPALQNNNQNKDQKQKAPEAMYTYIYSTGEDDKKPDTPAKFKGQLSLGVDELSNTLVVSAAGGLLENVTETIEALDLAARPTVNRMRVLKVDRNINAGEIQKRLKNLLTKPQPPQQPRQPGPPPQPNQNGGQLPHPDSTVVIENN
jgi:type II secretory pathway component GspD/PulD (secretin)